jgi:hypothetical protein
MQTRKTQTSRPYQAILERPGRAPTGMPKLESMPNPKKRKRAKKQAPKGAAPTQARGMMNRPVGPSTEQRRKNAAEQSRDEAGKFAENAWGRFWNGLFDPTPKPPTRLKKPAQPAARSFTEMRAVTPPGAKRRPAKKRKKPVPERSFFGKLAALYNGDYARWKMQQHRKLARYAAIAQGFDPTPRRRRRRRLKPAAARPVSRKPGLLRRLFQ